jgi:hypothetical protein
MALVGLMNTLKLEGSRYNILVNTIAPIAGTRMTATVMPPDMVEKLKPDFVSPVVVYACSEECTDSGVVWVAGAGYFSRAAMVEGPGIVLPAAKGISLEDIRDRVADIKKLEGAQPFGQANDQVARIIRSFEGRLTQSRQDTDGRGVGWTPRPYPSGPDRQARLRSRRRHCGRLFMFACRLPAGLE